MKVYLVQVYFNGIDYPTDVIGIYTTKEQAKENQNKFNERNAYNNNYIAHVEEYELNKNFTED